MRRIGGLIVGCPPICAVSPSVRVVSIEDVVFVNSVVLSIETLSELVIIDELLPDEFEQQVPLLPSTETRSQVAIQRATLSTAGAGKPALLLHIEAFFRRIPVARDSVSGLIFELFELPPCLTRPRAYGPVATHLGLIQASLCVSS